MANWQHCKLQGNRVTFLGARGVFENKKDAHMTDRAAFGSLEEEGWELVSVLPDPEGQGEFVYFFKRPLSE